MVRERETTMQAKVGWIYHSDFLRHITGERHPEQGSRLEVIVEALERARLLQAMEPLPFGPARPDDIALVHEPAYVELVRLLCAEGFTFIGSEETEVCRDSYEVALLASGGVLAACDAVMAGQVRRAFCAVRPPGHHAEADLAMGFCLFNHVAIAAEHLVRRHNLQRVAIVDLDVHHGNGTQHLFEERADVFYISLHERPGSIGFPESGEAEETGRGAGRGYTLNIPLDFGSQEADYRRAFAAQVEPALADYRPQFVLVSLGFDALMWDRISHISLEPESFGYLTDRLVRAADAQAQGRLVSVLEGGYDLLHLGAAAVAHVRSLFGAAPAEAEGEERRGEI